MRYVPDSVGIQDCAGENDCLGDKDPVSQDNEITTSLSFLICVTYAKFYDVF